MSLPGVKTQVRDGALGVSTSTGVGSYAVVGVASKPDETAIRIFSNPDEVEEKIGHGPLRDLLVNSLSIASGPVYAIALAATTNGTVSAITKGAANATRAVGTITVKAGSTPHAAYAMTVTITKDGALAEARATITLGRTTLPEFTLPVSGDYTIAGTGITLTFANGAPTKDQISFKALDTYSFTTTSPTVQNKSITDAVKKLIDSDYAFEFVAVAGATDKTLWGSLASLSETAAQKHKYIFAIAQARGKKEAETTDAYVQALKSTERGTATSKRLAISAAHLSLTDAISGITRVQPLITVLPGLIARRSVHEGCDAYKYGSIPNAHALHPQNLTDAHIEALMRSGYITARTYPYVPGIYITLGVLTAPTGSDFDTLEKIRVINKASAQVRIAMLRYVNDSVALLADEAGLAQVRLTALQPLDIMKNSGELSDAEVIIPPGQNILSTKTLKIVLRITPLGKLSYIENVITFYNPHHAGGAS